jgi:hypothetical protein
MRLFQGFLLAAGFASYPLLSDEYASAYGNLFDLSSFHSLTWLDSGRIAP